MTVVNYLWVPMGKVPQSGIQPYTSKAGWPCVEIESDSENIGAAKSVTTPTIKGDDPRTVRPRTYVRRAPICFERQDLAERGATALRHLAALCGAPSMAKPEPF